MGMSGDRAHWNWLYAPVVQKEVEIILSDDVVDNRDVGMMEGGEGAGEAGRGASGKT